MYKVSSAKPSLNLRHYPLRVLIGLGSRSGLAGGSCGGVIYGIAAGLLSLRYESPATQEPEALVGVAAVRVDSRLGGWGRLRLALRLAVLSSLPIGNQTPPYDKWEPRWSTVRYRVVSATDRCARVLCNDPCIIDRRAEWWNRYSHAVLASNSDPCSDTSGFPIDQALR
ncbi:hypothetical protein Hgul01_04974 [Herpetosiphon gulosus]|uniref:Uncharacterized protein n=1 Tax=Herpetosiphon gulosus TaxID=1973496 RepID=A0ABP9X6Y0_9CHLR